MTKHPLRQTYPVTCIFLYGCAHLSIDDCQSLIVNQYGRPYTKPDSLNKYFRKVLGELGHSLEAFYRTYARWVNGESDLAQRSKLDSSWD